MGGKGETPVAGQATPDLDFFLDSPSSLYGALIAGAAGVPFGAPTRKGVKLDMKKRGLLGFSLRACNLKQTPKAPVIQEVKESNV